MLAQLVATLTFLSQGALAVNVVRRVGSQHEPAKLDRELSYYKESPKELPVLRYSLNCDDKSPKRMPESQATYATRQHLADETSLPSSVCREADRILGSQAFWNYLGARVLKVDSSTKEPAAFHLMTCLNRCKRFQSHKMAEAACQYENDLPSIILEIGDPGAIAFPSRLADKQLIGYFKYYRHRNFLTVNSSVSDNCDVDMNSGLHILKQVDKSRSLETTSDVLASDSCFGVVSEQSQQDKVKLLPLIHSAFGVRKFWEADKTLRKQGMTLDIPMANRKIDVFIAGSLHEDNTPNYTEEFIVPLQHHRALAIEKLRSFKQKYEGKYAVEILEAHTPSELASYEDYMHTLCNSKIFVSPWGYGEWSMKEEEAALCRTVVVKPRASWLMALPPIYKQAVDVEMDFSDLEDVLLNTLSAKVDNEPLLQSKSRQIDAEISRVVGPDGWNAEVLESNDIMEQFASILRPLL